MSILLLQIKILRNFSHQTSDNACFLYVFHVRWLCTNEKFHNSYGGNKMAEKKPVQQAVPTEAETDAHVDDLVNKALKALEEFEDFTQEQVDYIVAKCSVAGLDHHGILAEAAVNETGRGVFEDKAVKNLFAFKNSRDHQ